MATTAKWRYRTTDNKILGAGYLSNGFAANELDPVDPDVVSEDLTEVQFKAYMADKAKPENVMVAFTRTGVGTYSI